MKKDFWAERWADGRIGFHQPKAHDFLARYADRLRPASAVYVPLCGKSLDLVWLAGNIAPVLGTEFVRSAIDSFFAEQSDSATVTDVAPFRVHRGRKLSTIALFEGDAFALTPAVIAAALGGPGTVEAVYDRAALVALDPPTRDRYVAGLVGLLKPGGKILLVVFDYDGSKLDGPPWAVGPAEVERLFGDYGTVELLEERPEPVGARYRQAGVTAIWERAYLISLNSAST
jgi:thiopurine S-methyltransferase